MINWLNSQIIINKIYKRQLNKTRVFTHSSFFIYNKYTTMINFKIKIDNKLIEINAFNETTKKYCLSFLSDEKPN